MPPVGVSGRRVPGTDGISAGVAAGVVGGKEFACSWAWAMKALKSNGVLFMLVLLLMSLLLLLLFLGQDDVALDIDII